MRFTLRILILAAAVMQPAGFLSAQGTKIDPQKFVQITIPADAPVEVVGTEFSRSHVTRAERSLSMELNLMVSLRNRSPKTVEAIALVLGYGFGGTPTEGASAVSGIRLQPGQTYRVPARMKAEIQIPAGRAANLPESAQLRIDAVLFSDGETYGPDQMHVLSTMRVNQAESARDRRFFQALLSSGGVPRVLPVLQRATEPTSAPELSAYTTPQEIRGAAAERARALAQLADFNVVRFSGAPVEIVSARARVYEKGLVDPAVEVRNTGRTDVVELQFGWVLRDAGGTEFRAATISASPVGAPRGVGMPPIRPGDTRLWTDRVVLETGPARKAPLISGRVYLRAVQFRDGRIWVPEWQMLEAAGLMRAQPTSPESIRLLRVYQSGGPAALSSELR